MIKRFGAIALMCVLVVSSALTGCTTNTYVPEGKAPTVATPVIGKEGTLRVGVDAQNPPFSAEGSGKVSGLDVDIAAALADDLGLKLEIVDIGSDPEKALEDDTVDIVMGIDTSDETISCWKSDAYLHSGVALFGASGASIPDSSSSPQIAAQSSSMSAWEVTDQYGAHCLVAAEDLKSAFAQLGSKQVDYVAADAIIGTYAAYVSDVEASAIALLQKPTGRSIGVREDNTELKTTISDALAVLTAGGIIPLIESRWLGQAVDAANLTRIDPEAQAATTDENADSDTSDVLGSDTAAVA